MRKAICTITTRSHLFKVMAVHDSLDERTDAEFHCLVMEDDGKPVAVDGITFHLLTDMPSAMMERIKARHGGNELRWACKPLFLLHLLAEGYAQVVYADNDMCFFGSPSPIFDALHAHSLLLTPHCYPADPQREQFWLEANFRVGLYNAGLVAAASGAEDALRWWADCCAYNVKQSAWRGLFDDQKYLDLVPVIFPETGILRHRGCNVAGWNTHMVQRMLDSEGNLMLNGQWPLVCIHFNAFTFRTILRGGDPLMRPHLEHYESLLHKWNEGYSVKQETRLRASDVRAYLRHLVWLFVRRMEQAGIL
ncbi:MAG: hypothetical protein K9J06_07395 [Flavobacteriales bacterium]|nr:hypothetical protein [Flavobacteriales bacterium]